MGEAKRRREAGDVVPRTMGRMHVRDPQYTKGNGALVVEMEYDAGFMMTEDHLKSAVFAGALRVKQIIRDHDLGPHVWPPALDVMPNKNMRGAVLVYRTTCHECRAPGPWLRT